MLYTSYAIASWWAELYQLAQIEITLRQWQHDVR